MAVIRFWLRLDSDPASPTTTPTTFAYDYASTSAYDYASTSTSTILNNSRPFSTSTSITLDLDPGIPHIDLDHSRPRPRPRQFSTILDLDISRPRQFSTSTILDLELDLDLDRLFLFLSLSPHPCLCTRPHRFYFTPDVPASITLTSDSTLCQQQSLLRADFAIATFLNNRYIKNVGINIVLYTIRSYIAGS